MAEFHVLSGADNAPAVTTVRHIYVSDIISALKAGLADFMAQPSHLLFLGLLYPTIGVFLAIWTSGANLLPVLFPLMSGFALLGPFAAIGLYEISRRRELGLDTSWRHAFEIWRSPSIPAIAALGLLLAVLFVSWLFAANLIYTTFMGSAAPQSVGDMLSQLLGSSRGWEAMIVGNLVGLAFAVITFGCSVIAFPLLLDRDVGAAVAVLTSFRAIRENPLAMGLWGVIVAVSLAAGFLLLFAGLAVVVPVLGHATWHLYRSVVVGVPMPQRNLPTQA